MGTIRVRPLDWAGLGPVDLAAQNRDLLAEQDDLELLVVLGAEPQHKRRQDATSQEVEERVDHQQAGRGQSPRTV